MSIESSSIATTPHYSAHRGQSPSKAHPTAIKTAQATSLILGTGTIIAVPISYALGIGDPISYASAIAIGTLLLLLPYSGKAPPPSPEQKIRDAGFADLLAQDPWECLEQMTQKQLENQEFLPLNDRHRFFDIRCPQDTAIQVDGEYLHANDVGKTISCHPLIASQAPLEAEQELFWKAVFHRNTTIVDLTNLHDQKYQGVDPYYPKHFQESRRYGIMRVKLVGILNNTYTYQVQNTKTGEEKTIRRHHFSTWPDHGCIPLDDLRILVSRIKTLAPNPSDPIWIHCRAGIGRTGTLMTAFILKEKQEKGEINLKHFDAFLVDLILQLRSDRGPDFVQRKEQFELLREYAASLQPLQSE